MINEYEINNSTLAIIPIDENTSHIYEEEAEYIINKNSNKLIDYNCKFYGSSYKGRCEGTKHLTGIKSKFPVIIEESRNIIFFPTSSYRSNENSWLALNKIKQYKANSCGTKIVFNNEKEIEFPISFYSLDNQFSRAIRLQAKLYEMKVQKNR